MSHGHNTDEISRNLELIGLTNYHYYVFTVVGSAWVSDMLWVINLSIIMENAGDEWDISDILRGLMSTIFMIGMFIGSYFWGYMGDKKGRIWSFRRTVAVSALSAVGVTASVNYLMLCCFLFVLGFGIGGEITVGGTYANEYLPPSKAWVYTLMCSTWCLGGIISALIALLIVLLGTGPMALWRSVSLVSCILEAIFWVSRLWTKETPKYLYVKGRKEECNQLFHFLAQKSKKEDFDIGLLQDLPVLAGDAEQEQDQEQQGGLKMILNKTYLKTTILITLVNYNQTFFFISYSFGSITFFMPEFLSNSGMSDSGTTLYLTLFVQQTAGALGIFLASYLVDTALGRRWTIVLGIILTAGFSFLFFLSNSPAMLISFSAAWNFTCEIGWSGLYTINAELYPTEIRGLGVGWGNAFSKFAGIINPVLTGLMLDFNGGKYLVMVLVGALFIASATASVFFRETRTILKAKGTMVDTKKSESFVF